MNKREFDHAYTRGRRARRDGVTVWVAATGDEVPPRLGIAIRSRAANAVIRNRMRRRIRDAFRAARVPSGTCVVVRGDSSLASRNFQELKDDLLGALEDAGLGSQR